MGPYQTPSFYSVKQPVNNNKVNDDIYRKKYWSMVPQTLSDNQYSPDISLQKKYGGPIGSYQISIIRPLIQFQYLQT